MAWIDLGEISVLPDVEAYTVGPVEFGGMDDTLWVRSQAVDYDTTWPYSFGLVSYLSDEGFELGTGKVYAKGEWESYAMSVGRPPQSRTGVLHYVPRNFNLAWVQKETIPALRLRLAYQTGQTGDGELLGSGSLSSFVDAVGTGLKFVNVGTKYVRIGP